MSAVGQSWQARGGPFPMLDAFLRALAPTVERPDLDAPTRARLLAALGSVIERGQEAWPGMALTPDQAASDMGRRLAAGVVDPVARLEARHAPDLYFACALGHGDRTAVKIFQRSFSPEIRGVLAKRGMAPDRIDDLEQAMREYLLVGSDARPGRIHDYRGEGPLRSWVLITAVRMAIRSQQQEQRAAARSTRVPVPALIGSAEDELLQRLYAKQLEEACHHALEGLASRERTLLRMQALDGATVDHIGQLYGVHRATAARWVARARQAVLERTRTFLVEQRGIAPEAVEAILRSSQSQLDVSVSRLLAATR